MGAKSFGSTITLSSRSSVTNKYISSFDTGLRPVLILGPSHMLARSMPGVRGSTARHTAWPQYCGCGASGMMAARVLEYRPSAPITRS
jgi:hypothetical protein